MFFVTKSEIETRVNQERISEDDFARTTSTWDSDFLVARQDVSFDIVNSSRSFNCLELWSDLDLTKRLDRIHTNS